MEKTFDSWPFAVDEGTIPVMESSIQKAKQDIANILVDPSQTSLFILRMRDEQESLDVKTILALLQNKDAEVFASFIDYIENWFFAYSKTFGPERAKQFLEILLKNLTQKTLATFPDWLAMIYQFDSEYAESLSTNIISLQPGLFLRNLDSWVAPFVAYFGIKKFKSILERFAELNQDLFDHSTWIDLFEKDPDFVRSLADRNTERFPQTLLKNAPIFTRIYGKSEVEKRITAYSRINFTDALLLRGHFRELANPVELLGPAITSKPFRTHLALILHTGKDSPEDHHGRQEAAALRKISKQAMWAFLNPLRIKRHLRSIPRP